MHSSLHSSNPIVRMLAHMATEGSGSVMSHSCNLLQHVYNIDSYDVVNGRCSLFKSRAYFIYNAEMVDGKGTFPQGHTTQHTQQVCRS